MIPEVDLGTVRQYRDMLRAALPDLAQGRAPNEVLSACLNILAEAVLLRLVLDIQKLRKSEVQPPEAMRLMEEITDVLSKTISDLVLRHIPDATFLRKFEKPRES